MQVPKLIALLQTFSKEEMKSFADYVQSPYFNKLEAPVKLYKVLMPLHPDFENLKWEKLFKKAFPDKATYSEAYLRNVLSDLHELGLGFLRQEVAEKNRSEGEFACVQQLIYRQLFKQADQQLEKVHDWIEKSWGDNDYNNLLADYYTFKMILHDRNEEEHHYSEAHQQKANYWQKALWEKVFSLVFEIETDKKVYYNYPYNIAALKKMLPVFDPTQFNNDPIVLAAYYRAMLLASNSWEWWITLYNHTKTAAVNMPDNQTHTCYRALLNHLDYVRKRELENRPNINELQMELMQEVVKLRDNNQKHLPDHLYLNITSIGCELYGPDWAFDYIDKNKHKLLPYLQEALPDYCSALLWFKLNNYPEAIALLSNIPNFRSDLYFSVKPYILMCYYETGNEEGIEYLFSSFKKTFKNHAKLAQGTQQAITNFITAFPLLCKLSVQYNLQQAQHLRAMIENPDTALIGKLWFEQKLSEITVKATSKTPKPIFKLK